MGQGPLNSKGNPVTINGTEITGPEKINDISNKMGTLATNNSFTVGGSVFLNFKITGLNINANSSNIVANISSMYRPSNEVSCISTLGSGTTIVPTSCWIATDGNIKFTSSSNVSNYELRVVAAYIK